MNNKQWCCKSSFKTDSPEVISLARDMSVSPLTALLLKNRGINEKSEAEKFLNMSDFYIYDPFLMPDMKKAVDRILQAVKNGEKMLIYGDYDVDGVTSVSILYKYLEELGNTPLYHVPSRMTEGYGVNNEAIDSFAKMGVTLMITVDTGITAVNEAEHAKNLGIDTVITDHHECQETIPNAVAVVNPKRQDSIYPFKELAGVGVVFKLICAIEMTLFKERGDKGNYLEGVCRKYLDLVALGTVADVMPLVDENRLMVSMGLSLMKNSIRPAIKMLLESALNEKQGEKKFLISSSTVSYTLAPRINAAGRMESAESAVELFLSNNENEARELAIRLCEINKRRQDEENSIVASAIKQIGKLDEETKIIVLSEDNWSSGIIGIVASRITERFSLPSILISFEGDIGKGSGRSIGGINLVEALHSCCDLLEKYGGHSLAAGLTVKRENLDAFVKRINEYVALQTKGRDIIPTIEYETELSPLEITVKEANEQLLLEPFGVSNPTPVFMLANARVSDIMELSAGKHTKLLLEKDGVTFTALMFGSSRSTLDLYIGEYVDVLFTMNNNEFRGTVSVQLIVKDIRLCSDTLTKQERARYTQIADGAQYGREENILPTRDEMAKLYIYIKGKCGNSKDLYITARELMSFCKLSYAKVKFSVKVLADSGLVNVQSFDKRGDVYRFGINYVKSKVDIENSPYYVRLKTQRR